MELSVFDFYIKKGELKTIIWKLGVAVKSILIFPSRNISRPALWGKHGGTPDSGDTIDSTQSDTDNKKSAGQESAPAETETTVSA